MQRSLIISKSSIEMKFVIMTNRKVKRNSFEQFIPHPQGIVSGSSRVNLKGINPICIDERREKEGSIELWNRKCCIPSKKYRDRMISVFEVTLENWKPIFKLESLTFRQLLYLHSHLFYPSSFPVATNRNLFKQAVRLTGCLLRRRFVGKLQFPAWNLPEIIS